MRLSALLVALAILCAPALAHAGAVSGVSGTLDVTIVGPNVNTFTCSNCSGSTGGTASNASDGVATSSTNDAADSWLYGFNGTSWDRLRVDSGKDLLVGTLDCKDVTFGCMADAATCATANTAMSCLRQIDADIKGVGTIQGNGTAGTADTHVVTIQGIASGTPAPVSGTFWQATQPVSIAAPATAVRGSASTTGTGATTIIAAQGGGVKTYVTGLQCGRSDAGTSAITITFNDSASTVMVLPNLGGGGASNMALPVPLVTAANTAFTFAPSSGTTTVYCNAQGYSGS